ncbi:MAG: cell division protein FtsA [Treponema sp.]|nr:cell division protein FtsA [Treponema sp.]
MANDNTVVGLDIGTTKVCAVIGESTAEDTVRIIGIGVAPSTGMRKGVVVNIEATIRAITEAIERAELMAGREVHTCWVSIGGNHIEGINSRGVVAVTGKNQDDRIIEQEDIKRVLESARAVLIPMDRRVLEVIPQSFIVDNQKGIHTPLGLSGVRLEAEVHIITCSVTSAQNLINCVNRAGVGYKVQNLILQPLAAGCAVLDEEEKERGVILIDLGGGTTDVLLFSKGAAYSTMVIPIGGSMVTSDISKVKSISFETAERIKVESGSCWEETPVQTVDILIPESSGQPSFSIPHAQLTMIIRARVEELFVMIKEKIDHHAAHSFDSGIVLTGGGANLKGIVELAKYVFDMPVQIGIPKNTDSIGEEYQNPLYATAIGLVLEGNHREQQDDTDNTVTLSKNNTRTATVWQKIINWFKEFF